MPSLKGHLTASISILNSDIEHAFKVVLKDSGIELDVRADQTLLDVLNGAGIDVNCDCREGLCASCEAEVIEGEVDHRDRVQSRPEREGGKRMMTCCSRAVGRRTTLAL